MPLTPFRKGTHFGPDQIAVMVAAYEAAMRELDLTAHSPGAVTVAKTIFFLVTHGERDPICDDISEFESYMPSQAVGSEAVAE